VTQIQLDTDGAPASQAPVGERRLPGLHGPAGSRSG
jgi:hypothetical protein